MFFVWLYNFVILVYKYTEKTLERAQVTKLDIFFVLFYSELQVLLFDAFNIKIITMKSL